MKIKRYTEANRQAWNEAMPRHQNAAKNIKTTTSLYGSMKSRKPYTL